MNVITHTFVGLKCLTESKIQILCDHVSHTRLHTVEMGCQMVQLSANNVCQFDLSLCPPKRLTHLYQRSDSQVYLKRNHLQRAVRILRVKINGYMENEAFMIL